MARRKSSMIFKTAEESEKFFTGTFFKMLRKSEPIDLNDCVREYPELRAMVQDFLIRKEVSRALEKLDTEDLLIGLEKSVKNGLLTADFADRVTSAIGER